MAPLSERNGKIAMKMHCQDFEKMHYFVFVKFLCWPSGANLGIGFDLSTSKIPILVKSKTRGTPIVFSPSEAFKSPILFDRGSDGPNLGPPNFSKEKYKGPMAPVSENKLKITMKMHC